MLHLFSKAGTPQFIKNGPFQDCSKRLQSIFETEFKYVYFNNHRNCKMQKYKLYIRSTHKYHHFVILHYFLQTVFILLIPSFASIITLKCIQVIVCYYCFYKSHNFHPNFVYKATIYFKYYFQIVYLVYPGSKFVRTRIAYTRKSSLASCS